MGFKLWGVLGEYGNSLGWKYIFWDQMDGFLSPVDRSELSYGFPGRLEFGKITLPARREYYRLADHLGDPRAVLVVCGYWGQGPIVKVVRTLLAEEPGLRVTVVCGENTAACDRTKRAFGNNPNVAVHAVVPSLLPFFAECSCVVTKPGISTLLEAHAACRKIFLLPGMPVAEDHNARYAVQHFGAEWFSQASFRGWRRALAA
jgi:UDP-N-acetylglucosamine:LPS N-acetylglucosamine transferase